MFKIKKDKDPRRTRFRKDTHRFPKTERERRKTREEVQQIKRSLIDFATTKWGKKWIHSLLKIGRPFRMRRGINYAEDEERINNLTIHKGEIFATVQGTAPSPYRVKIKFDLISQGIWGTVLDSFSLKLINLAHLLEGILPEELIDLFEQESHSLFPDASLGLDAKCSCPDSAVPCKHIAAVILYLARVIDYNPFILLKLRGKNRDELIQEFGLTFRSSRKNAEKKAQEDTRVKEKGLTNIPAIEIDEVNSKFAKTPNEVDVEFHFRKPGSRTGIIHNLGVPENLEYKKEFKIVMNKIYEKIMNLVYRKATFSEKKERK
ncbi:MAG: SWIM zinc finger family protein [Promethearchaeia archaeon]